jgi:predicted flavoprotein YhiN
MILVVGAGAAGIFAAWRAASLGARVTLLEKTSRIGTKILISGGGKCNITHDGPIEEVLRAFRPEEARFIRPACYRWTNRQVVEMLTSRGLEVYTRPDGRIFPVDGTAKDVLRILRSYLDEAGVEVRLDSPVVDVHAEGGRIVGVTVGPPMPAHKGYAKPTAGYGAKSLLQAVQAEDTPSGAARSGEELIACERLVLAVGGSSYPNSGTTGDGWPWARALGHTVLKPQAALAPIYLEGADPERSGVALRDCVLKARLAGKEIARWRGDLLFTHHGVSGPCALGVSRVVAERLAQGEIALEADIVPNLPHERLQEEFVAVGREHPKRPVCSLIALHLPSRLSDDLCRESGVDPDLPAGRLDKRSRNRLVEALKGWRLGAVRHVPLEKGEVVAGGVALDEVDPQTMHSRLVEGLYLCGEILDIAGPVGGYNLQAAFATGYVAGESATHP